MQDRVTSCCMVYMTLCIISNSYSMGGVLYAEYSTRGGVERTIQNEAKPSVVLFSRPCPECYILHTVLPPMP